jgi:hypothetical protein
MWATHKPHECKAAKAAKPKADVKPNEKAANGSAPNVLALARALIAVSSAANDDDDDDDM